MIKLKATIECDSKEKKVLVRKPFLLLGILFLIFMVIICLIIPYLGKREYEKRRRIMEQKKEHGIHDKSSFFLTTSLRRCVSRKRFCILLTAKHTKFTKDSNNLFLSRRGTKNAKGFNIDYSRPYVASPINNLTRRGGKPLTIHTTPLA
jgi:hypothetical protein